MSDPGSPLRTGVEPGFVERCLKEFGETVRQMGLPLGASDGQMVQTWLDFYSHWPGRRVIGFDDPKDVAAKLLADSYAVRLLEPAMMAGPAIDLGSGNGWPGLALVSVGPVSLLDSRRGACDFMRDLISHAGLGDVDVIEARAEEAGLETGLTDHFGIAVTRAMTSAALAVEIISPFVKPGGTAVLWLGPAQEEVVETNHELRQIGLTLTGLRRYELPGGMGRRALAVYRKTGAGLKGFPRKIASIKARPLF